MGCGLINDQFLLITTHNTIFYKIFKISDQRKNFIVLTIKKKKTNYNLKCKLSKIAQ